MPESKLRHLRPVSGEHSIQETVFTLFLAPDTPFRDPEKYEQIHAGVLKQTFPKYQALVLHEAAIHADLLKQEARFDALGGERVFGFTFEDYFRDGRLKTRLRGENGEAPRPWLAVNLLEYPGWTKALPFAERWIKKVANFEKTLKVAAVGLHYIDHLYWDSSDNPDMSSVFNRGSKFLPARLGQEVEGWSSKIGYNFAKGDNRQTDNVEVYVQHNLQTGHRRFVVNIPLRIDLASPTPLKKFINDKGDSGFRALANSMHDDNKEIGRAHV